MGLNADTKRSVFNLTVKHCPCFTRSFFYDVTTAATFRQNMNQPHDAYRTYSGREGETVTHLVDVPGDGDGDLAAVSREEADGLVAAVDFGAVDLQDLVARADPPVPRRDAARLHLKQPRTQPVTSQLTTTHMHAMPVETTV